MSLNKKYISKRISNSINIPINESKEILDKFLNTILSNSSSKKIKIKNFGTFNYVNTVQRFGRNPKTKESYIIKPMKKLLFKSSSILKKILN